MRKPSIACLGRKALKLWSLVVRSRAGYKCEVCGATEHLNSHHIEDKASWILRFDPQNAVCVCPSCHKFGRNSFHRSPVWATEWLLDHARSRVDAVLDQRDMAVPKDRRTWLQGILVKLEAMPHG